MMNRPPYFSSNHLKYLLVAAILFLFLVETEAQCGGTCSACAQRFGCRTAAWGQCCTQFYMHNGKRSDMPIIEGFIEYVKLKSKIVNQQEPGLLNSNEGEQFRTDDVNSQSDIRNNPELFLARDVSPRLLNVLRRKEAYSPPEQ